MTAVVLAEKPSAAKNMANALGGAPQGSFEGTDYVVVNARGHLVALRQPSDPAMVKDAADAARKKSWDLGNLPWRDTEFTWAMEPRGDVARELAAIKKACQGADELVIAADLDPTGEGTALAGYIVQHLGLEGMRLSRMEFLDETPKSIQEAFRNRRPFGRMEDEGDFRKARFRNKFDWLSMQFTRIASRCAGLQEDGKGVVLRQGRLKSAMVVLVGDGLKAHEEYVKKPFFENRFRDENGVVYTNPEEPRFDAQADVPQQYGRSAVVEDSRAQKRTAPRRLIDLAGLSAMLSTKGVKADQVLKVYQALYEYKGNGGRSDGLNSGADKAGLASYPRTEDRFISNEQFAEMLPIADEIAKVVGVDPAILTHRTARSTHVKDGGAHGANRPGTIVPASLDWVKQNFGPTGALIYETIALSFLAMLAEDYVYEQQKGHVADHPAFVGSANVPVSQGWKQVFDDSDDPDDEENAKGLGTQADPFVHEGANTRPPHPTMKWLMAQLSKRNVGTGATRTSIYADVTSEKGDWPLLAERRGKITMTDHGKASYLMLAGTRIGDLGATEHVQQVMKDIEDGKATEEQHLPTMAEWVEHDLQRMKQNAPLMRKALGLPDAPVPAERIHGTWARTGEAKSFKGTWGANPHWEGHSFTPEEAEKLFADEEIEFQAVSKAGNPYTAKGRLEQGEWNGRPTFGFKLDFGDPNKVPDSWSGYEFSDAEKADLEAGKKIFVRGAVSKKSGNSFDCTLSFKKERGSDRKKLVPEFGDKK